METCNDKEHDFGVTYQLHVAQSDPGLVSGLVYGPLTYAPMLPAQTGNITPFKMTGMRFRPNCALTLP